MYEKKISEFFSLTKNQNLIQNFNKRMKLNHNCLGIFMKTSEIL